MPRYEVTINGLPYYIPERMMEGIERYVKERIKPGDFLCAVICNDLHMAFGRADRENFRNIPAYLSYFYNHAPVNCWGSKANMKFWLKGDKKDG